MKASEARILSDKNNSTAFIDLLNVVRERIKTACENGEYSVQYSLSEHIQSKNVVVLVIEQLEEDGYKVERNKGYDQRDDYSWDCIIIGW